ncbi:MFS transporter [Tsukamurella pseudospumae]|uniref:Major facilitator superfamily (MFS) profile domain-containing protein n=1 Tax=Tsukamurella pseudospumae TaxID=239498 RepID=A0A137ZZT2_9ACTN|nr:MFS transporter [Tsukamurella pseudospumae]KXP03659.1 hypothetical protein AXK60_17810 [Tsukamurella pseudospumae]
MKDGTGSDGRRRALLAATVGSAVESFDWNVYAVLAPFFAVSMFPAHGASALLAAYAGFAVGFLARPLGGVVVGWASDRYGRRPTLAFCMVAISAASLGMAILPTSAMIGAWAAVLIVILRLVQGFAFGGETSTVAAYVSEVAPPGRRFSYGALSYSGTAGGSLIAFGVVAALTAVYGRDGLSDGAWRWGFAAAAVAGLCAIWVRFRAPESAAFTAEGSTSRSGRSPLGPLLSEQRTAVVTVALMTAAGTVPVYFALVYLPVYADTVGRVDKAAVSGTMAVVLAVVVGAIVAFGRLMDRFDPIRVLRIAYLVQALGTVPLLWAFRQGLVPFVAVALLLGIALAPTLAIGNVLYGLLFPTMLRAVGSGLGMAIAIAALGGTLPMVAEWLSTRGWYGWLPVYVASAAVCGLIGLGSAVRSGRLRAVLARSPEPIPTQR